MVSVEIDSVSVLRMGETPARKRTKRREGTNWSLTTPTCVILESEVYL